MQRAAHLPRSHRRLRQAPGFGTPRSRPTARARSAALSVSVVHPVRSTVTRRRKRGSCGRARAHLRLHGQGRLFCIVQHLCSPPPQAVLHVPAAGFAGCTGVCRTGTGALPGQVPGSAPTLKPPASLCTGSAVSITAYGPRNRTGRAGQRARQGIDSAMVAQGRGMRQRRARLGCAAAVRLALCLAQPPVVAPGLPAAAARRGIGRSGREQPPGGGERGQQRRAPHRILGRRGGVRRGRCGVGPLHVTAMAGARCAAPRPAHAGFQKWP